MKEWKHLPDQEVRDPKARTTRWRYEGDIPLSLICNRSETFDDSYAYFEMARVINGEQLMDLIELTEDKKYAQIALSKGEEYYDPFWVGYSLEELEQFCQERMLPLPEDYQSAWTSLTDEQ